MTTSNHSSSRIYWLSRPGQRLAAYLDYVNSHPDLSPDILFADSSVPPDPPAPVAPPEQYDDERQPLPDTWNPHITPWEDIPPADDDDYGKHSPEED